MINSGNIKGKDGSVTTYNPIHPHEEEQHIKGSVLGGDNIERETRDRDPIPTKTNRTPIYASSPTFPDQEQKPKAGALRREEDDHKIRNAQHDGVPSKVFAKDNGEQLAPNQLGEKSNMYMRTVNESPSRSKDQQLKSTKPNQAVDGVLHTGTYHGLLPSSSKKFDGALISVGDINRDVGHVSSKVQPKSSDGLKEKPRIENIKLIKQHEPPKDEADLSNSEIGPRKTIEHPVMHDKEDVVSKESPKNINGRRAESSTTVDQWGGGGNIIPNQLLGGQPESSLKQKDWSSNVGSPGTKALPNQLDDHPLKEQPQNNFLGRENPTDKKYATSNSLDSSEVMNIPEGYPIHDKIGEVTPVSVVVIQPPPSDKKKNEKIEVELKVTICCRCSIL